MEGTGAGRGRDRVGRRRGTGRGGRGDGGVLGKVGTKTCELLSDLHLTSAAMMVRVRLCQKGLIIFMNGGIGFDYLLHANQGFGDAL